MEVKLNLNNRQLAILTGILGVTYSDEMFDVYEQLYPNLKQVDMELVDEFTQHFINFNIDEAELFDDILTRYLVRELGR